MSRHGDELRDLAAAVRALAKAVDRLQGDRRATGEGRPQSWDRAGKRSRVMLTQDEAGEYLRTTRSTLATWRCRGLGPPFVKIGDGRGSRVAYRLSDLDKWLDDHRVEAGS